MGTHTDRSRTCSTNEAALRLGLSASTVRKMVREGLLVAESEGGNWRVLTSSVDARLAAQRRAEGLHESHEADAPPVVPDRPPEDGLQDLVLAIFGESRLLLTTTETALLLGLRTRAVQDAARLGQIPCREIGGTRYVPMPALAEWLRMQGAA